MFFPAYDNAYTRNSNQQNVKKAEKIVIQKYHVVDEVADGLTSEICANRNFLIFENIPTIIPKY